MKRSPVLGLILLAWSTSGVTAQRDNTNVDAAVYLAVLQEMPPIATDRTAVVDPRLAASFGSGAHPLDVWEGHHAGESESPAVRQLRQMTSGIEFCAETAPRRCLPTADVVHVTFSDVVIEDSTVTVEATLATRTSDERDSFDIQTWRYVFNLEPDGPVAASRELLGRGHGRIGGHR